MGTSTFDHVPVCFTAVTWRGAGEPTAEVIQLHINTSKALIKTKTSPDPPPGLTVYDEGPKTIC